MENDKEQVSKSVPDFDQVIQKVHKYITPDLAFVVEIEWQRARIGGSQDLASRLTIIHPKTSICNQLSVMSDALL